MSDDPNDVVRWLESDEPSESRQPTTAELAAVVRERIWHGGARHDDGHHAAVAALDALVARCERRVAELEASVCSCPTPRCDGGNRPELEDAVSDTNRQLPPDSPLNELRQLREYVEMHGDGFSAENWAVVEAALTRVAGIVVAADRWAHGYESCSSAPIDKYLFMVVRGLTEIGVPVKTPWGATETVPFEDGLTIPPAEWGNFA